MGEANAGGGERLLGGPGELSHIPKGGDSDRPSDAGQPEGRRYPICHAKHIHAHRDVAVLEVPPDGDLHVPAVFLVVPPGRRRRRTERMRRRRRRRGREGFRPPPVGLVAGARVEEDEREMVRRERDGRRGEYADEEGSRN